MPDLKLAPLLEAATVDGLRPSLNAFFGADAPIVVESIRLQAPIAFWAVYRSGRRRAVLKSLFAEDEAVAYCDGLSGQYPDRVGCPRHRLGGIHLLPDLNGVLWGLPFDPSMTELPRCLDGAWIADLLGYPGVLTPELQAYDPETEAVVTYRAADAGSTGEAVARGRVSVDDTAGLTFVVMNRLWPRFNSPTSPVRLARPLAFRSAERLLLTEPTSGRPIDPDRNRRAFLELVQAASAGLATLHATDVPFGSTRGLDDPLARLRWGLEELALVAPPLHITLRHLLEQLEARADRTLADPLVPSHGAFSWDQLLEHRGRFALPDLGRICRAEPAYDVGYFCAHLIPARPADWEEGAAAEHLRTRFLRWYFESATTLPSLERVGLYEAAALAIRALGHARRHQPDWQLVASQLLDLAFERLVSPEPSELDPGNLTATSLV